MFTCGLFFTTRLRLVQGQVQERRARELFVSCVDSPRGEAGRSTLFLKHPRYEPRAHPPSVIQNFWTIHIPRNSQTLWFHLSADHRTRTPGCEALCCRSKPLHPSPQSQGLGGVEPFSSRLFAVPKGRFVATWFTSASGVCFSSQIFPTPRGRLSFRLFPVLSRQVQQSLPFERVLLNEQALSF